jgi:hypothetical protein
VFVVPVLTLRVADAYAWKVIESPTAHVKVSDISIDIWSPALPENPVTPSAVITPFR